MRQAGGRRSGGRRERVARRAAGPAVDPCPPGQAGGAYRPLADDQLRRITETAFRLLDELGMGEVPERLGRDLLAAGAREADGRVHLPRAMVARALELASKRFTLHGRDPTRSIDVGGEAVHFGTGGAAVQTLDLDSGLYRPSTLRDLRDFTRLQDTLRNVSWFTRCCVATDMPSDLELDANTVHALLSNTTKPVATSFTTAETMPPILGMLDIAAGGPGAFAERPFLKAHISPVISPMRFGEDAIAVLYGCLEANIPVSCITAAQSGATAPATLAGFLAQSLAETLASLVAVNVVKPGHPMVFSNWPLVIDLRTGAFAGGGGEIAVLNAASAQLSNALGLPSGVASSMTDAKAIDAQHGAEKALTALAAGLAGGNLIYESSGMTASLLGASFEAFLLDDEMHSAIYRTLRGIEVDDETLGFDTVRDAVLGEGHFLGHAATYAAMERDYHYPIFADRQTPATWAEDGARDAWSRARTRAREILDTHRPQYLSPEQDAAMRDLAPIRD
ncbi:MAG: trimethylamine methyltransferase family protein [Shimia sp.]